MSDIVIVSAARTPVGSFNGALSSLPAHELGKIAILAAVARAGIPVAAVDAGAPVDSPAWSLNQLCGAGLRAIALGAQQIQDGSADIVIAGGQESMSQSPHAAHLRNGQKLGDLSFVAAMIKDGL